MYEDIWGLSFCVINFKNICCIIKIVLDTRWFKYDRDWCRQIYTQISPNHIWTTLYIEMEMKIMYKVSMKITILLFKS